jgi:NAD(P)-dependent dehydrogenase (short-subunit alcohol dehydrogenase family)
MLAQFKDKTVVITGGGGGLAGALIEQLLPLGANVAALDVNTESLEPSAQLLPITVDITDNEALEQAVEQVVQQFGGIDVLFNNAGITHMSLFATLPAELFDTIMAVNFTSAVTLTRMCLPWLTKSKGQVVAISSVAGFAPLYGRSAYSASKHAMEGFFSSLASEVADDGVGVLVVCPSFVKSRPGLVSKVSDGLRSPGAMKKNTNGEQLPANVAAERILMATAKRKRRLHLGRVAKMAYWLYTLLPEVYQRVMSKGAKREFE